MFRTQRLPQRRGGASEPERSCIGHRRVNNTEQKKWYVKRIRQGKGCRSNGLCKLVKLICDCESNEAYVDLERDDIWFEKVRCLSKIKSRLWATLAVLSGYCEFLKVFVWVRWSQNSSVSRNLQLFKWKSCIAYCCLLSTNGLSNLIPGTVKKARSVFWPDGEIGDFIWFC